ncbi:MAG: cytochrome c oxidase subunit 3 [Ilumatobacteraceae bacterium]|jgi:heme/copper-type cytochrome/quinol oxidase subunit 3|nr:cytochrome c oxidase subunit 3 [Ilumatobacteraceae bacterium]MDP4703024.1 cytochrome c oxidase subunit 3 [Ilumatobacteraceae bacterium]MDP5109687.1 cytochrome c oxidase subunit 3 [Ilumatobacteraceae bacterium]
MTYALPAGPRPAPRRQLFMSTGIAVAAGTMLMGGMLALWLRFRAAAPTRPSSDGFKLIKDWLPADLKMPEVVTNVGILSFLVMGVMVQWAAYAARRGDSKHVVAALSLTLLFGIAILNAQAAIFVQFNIGVASGTYQSMFYAIVGTLTVLIVSGVVFTVASLFKSIGGRAANTDLLNAHALYWYFLAAAYTAVWFVVFVQK